ncbi:MAG: hypothetical protein LYZ70_07070 [Nitrososphaerales archaeon]|nr:hypothetical protein [Nitrososphaerales archaeon]
MKKDIQIDALRDVLVRSGLVFRATVRKLESSSLTSLLGNPRTAVCHVDEVIHGPPQLGDLTGQDITLERLEARPLKVGQRAVFFASGWLYGETIAVKEVERVEDADMGLLRKRVSEALRLNADSALKDRLAKAELVISGRVSKVTRAAERAFGGPSSFHDPDWWVAKAEVDSVEKGRITDKSLSILFPASGDTFWVRSPKFREGQEGVWILRKDQQEKGRPSHRVPGLTALDPLDFHSKDELERIRKLTKSGR